LSVDTIQTQPLADAIIEAEGLIRAAPHVKTEQDLVEGLEYLAGLIRASVQSACAYDRDFPYLIHSATAQAKVGMDNPDTVYLSTVIRDDCEYVLNGRRGTTADLNFQVLGGEYNADGTPASLAAFDDRSLDVAADGTFEVRFGPARLDAGAGAGYIALEPGATMLLIRECYRDWSSERQGTIRIQRADRIGLAPPPPPPDLPAKRFNSAGKALVQQVRAFLAFPEWFYLNLPVNTLTEPRLTPGGLATQYSSVGHFDLAEHQAMIVTVPVSDAPYHGFQLGSMWYISLDFINHQTSLSSAQARHDPDGKIRYVISEHNPGLTNWLELTGHERGYLQMRWQRLSRALAAQDGPQLELVDFDELPDRLPFYEEERIDDRGWRQRIAARQAAVAERMLG